MFLEVRHSVTDCVIRNRQDGSFIESSWLKEGEEGFKEKMKKGEERKRSEALLGK